MRAVLEDGVFCRQCKRKCFDLKVEWKTMETSEGTLKPLVLSAVICMFCGTLAPWDVKEIKDASNS